MACESDAKRSEAWIFFEKNIKKGPKIHCLALKLYTGPPNSITGASKSEDPLVHVSIVEWLDYPLSTTLGSHFS